MHNLYRNLTKRLTILGLPYIYFLIFAGISYVSTIVVMLPYLNIIIIPLYVVARIINKKDEYFIEILIERYTYKKNYYA